MVFGLRDSKISQRVHLHHQLFFLKHFCFILNVGRCNNKNNNNKNNNNKNINIINIMWQIHGKIYDLTKFADIHPGGSLLLNSCKGNKDATAAFESYHALCDMKKIQSIMKKYEIEGTSKCDFKFDNDGFYKIIKEKIRVYFIQKKISHHANFFWIIKSVIQAILYLTSFLTASYCHYLPMKDRILLNLFAGHMFIQYGFSVMHDASHFAVSKNKVYNEWLSKIWNSLALWDNQLWHRHHSYKHHSYTGTIEDPDTIHLSPFIRKSFNEKSDKYWKYTNILVIISTCIFPGMWLGQGIVYMRALLKNRFWRMKIEIYNFSYIETLLKIFTLVSLIYSQNIFVVSAFILTCNITYFLCILPDHDTLKTHQNITYDNENCDWGELQVRNSANFSTQNSLVNNCFGGINYQIEHHLFPTISHVHYPEISLIVKKTCAEYNIPYVEYPTIYSAMSSVFQNFQTISHSKR